MNVYLHNPLTLVQDEYGNPWYLRLGVLWSEDPEAVGLLEVMQQAKPLLVFEYAAAEVALDGWIRSN